MAEHGKSDAPAPPDTKVGEPTGPCGKDEKDNNDHPPFDLEMCASVAEAKELGMDRLKEILTSMGCKCGGSLDERAARLFSLKGLKREDYPKKVRGKNFQEFCHLNKFIYEKSRIRSYRWEYKPS